MSLRNISLILFIISFAQSYGQSTDYISKPFGYFDVTTTFAEDGGIKPDTIAIVNLRFQIDKPSQIESIKFTAGRSYGDNSGISANFQLQYNPDLGTFSLWYDSEEVEVYDNNSVLIDFSTLKLDLGNWSYCELSIKDNSGTIHSPIKFNI